MLQYVLDLSTQGNDQTVEGSTPKSLEDVIALLSKHVKKSSVNIVIRRRNFLEDTMRKCCRETFDPCKMIQVEFVGEVGIDTGGLSREFFSLLERNVTPQYITANGSFVHDSVALKDGVFYRLGQLASMSLVQGGSGFNVLCPSVFKYICGMELQNICPTPDEVSDSEIANVVQQFHSCTTVGELRELYSSHFSVLCDCGITKPSTSIALEDRSSIVESLCLHDVLLSSKAEMDQFRDGLASANVLTVFSNSSEIVEAFFVKKKRQELTSDILRNVFKIIRYSDEGSNHRPREEATYMYFVNYLEEIEEGKNASGVTLSNVLNFFSGADRVPPCGFPGFPTLSFNDSNAFPTASTCALELTLPTKFDTYSTFEKNADLAFLDHGGFGLV